jgi:hypothetical protein
MKKFFFSHPDVILAAIAFILLAVLIGSFSWGIKDVVFEIHRSMVAPNTETQQTFDLNGAASLGIKIPTSTNATVVSSSVSNTATATSTPFTIPDPAPPSKP